MLYDQVVGKRGENSETVTLFDSQRGGTSPGCQCRNYLCICQPRIDPLGTSRAKSASTTLCSGRCTKTARTESLSARSGKSSKYSHAMGYAHSRIRPHAYRWHRTLLSRK